MAISSIKAPGRQIVELVKRVTSPRDIMTPAAFEKAIQVDSLGQIIVSPTLCTACGTCEILCPIGAIELFEEIPLVCDLCGGDPRCVQACTLDALHFEPEATGVISLKEFKTFK